MKSTLETLPKEQQMDMKEFHLIFTQSNELIQVVDCRSQEEYDACHISGSHRLVYTFNLSLPSRNIGNKERIGESILFVLSTTLALVNAQLL